MTSRTRLPPINLTGRQAGLVNYSVLGMLSLLAILCLILFARHQLEGRFRMALAHAHFSEAVKSARRNLTASGVPASTGEWIAQFNSQALFAPGGGPAFVVNSDGNVNTGAIGVGATGYGTEVHIVRPAYLALTAHKVVVTVHDVTHEPPLADLDH